MKYAIVGCGRISSNHIAAAQENNLEIVALCDLKLQAMDEKKKKFNLEHTRLYTDYIQMVNEEKPDLVAICTESGKHAEIALKLISHGVNLIIEKPIALSIQDANKIINESKKYNVKVCACHQNRFNKSIQKIKEAKDQGRFGKIFHGTAHIRWNRGKSYYDQAKWRGTWEQDGGALMNQCIHNIDLLRWLMDDDISQVMAYTDNLNHPYIEAEDLGLAIIKFKSGSYGMIEGTTNVFPENLEETLYIFGENGTVKAGGKSANLLEEWNFDDSKDNRVDVIREYHELPPDIYGYGHIPLYKDVIEAIENDRQPYVDAEEGKKSLELVLGIYKSSKENSPISFPLDEYSTLNMDPKNK